MPNVFRIFFEARGTKPWRVLPCLVLASLLEGVSIATLLPILAVATGEVGEIDSPLYDGIHEAFAWLGVSPSLGALLLLIVVTIILKSVFSMLAMTYLGYAMAEVSTNLREQLVRGLLRVRWAYFTGEPVGRVANAMSVDATRAGIAYLAVSQIFIYLVNAIVLSIIAFVTSWRVALAALALGLVILTSLNVFVRMMRRAGRKQTERTQDLVAYLTDMLANIKPLKAMHRQEAMAMVFTRKTTRLRSALRTQVMSLYFLEHAQNLLAVALLAAGFYVGSVYFEIPVSELTVMGVLLLQVARSFNHLQRKVQKALQFESAYWNVIALIREVARAEEGASGTSSPIFEESVELEDVTIGFDGSKVLKGVDLTIPKGRVVLLTGESGAGKTTLTDLIMGLRLPDSGVVRLDGQPLTEIDISAWRGRIGYVPQESFILHDTIRTNIALGDPAINDEMIWRALEMAEASAHVRTLPEQLDAVVGEKGMRLSGGQRQRLAIARAIVTGPQLLVLDEVTSNLDPKTERDICSMVRGLAGNLTVLAVSHREAWLETADRTYEISAGQLLDRSAAREESYVVPSAADAN